VALYMFCLLCYMLHFCLFLVDLLRVHTPLGGISPSDDESIYLGLLPLLVLGGDVRGDDDGGDGSCHGGDGGVDLEISPDDAYDAVAVSLSRAKSEGGVDKEPLSVWYSL